MRPSSVAAPLATLVIAVGIGAGVFLARADREARPARTFRATPTEPSAESSEGENARPRDGDYGALDEAVSSVMYDAMTNDTSAEDAAYLRERLVEALAMERLGTVADRVRVAHAEVGDLLERLSKEPKLEGELTALQERAMEQEAKRWRRRIVARLDAADDRPARSVDGYPKADWRTLTGFSYRPGMDLPEAVTALDGQRVAIDGYMIITSWGEDRRVEQFLLTESMWGCCFARTPQIHEGIVVDAPGVKGNEGPITVLGVLEVKERKQDGEVVGIYRVRAHQVRPLQP